MNMQTIKNMGFGTTIIAGFSYLGAIVKKREETSLENFYINRFGKKLYSMFFEGYTEKLWGRHPKDISADWGSQRVKGLSIAAVLKDILQKVLPVKNKEVETSLIEEFSYPKFGPGQLWEIVADEIQSRGGTIIKNAKVVKMATNGNQIASVSYLENGEEKTLEGDIFVSSMPLKDLIAAQNDVPQNIQRIAEGLPYRDFVTVGLLLNSLNIKNETKLKTLANIVPDSWIYVQDTGVKLGRIQIFNNWSPYMVNDPEKTIWIGLEYFCTEGDKYWDMTEDEWKEKGVSELVTMGVINQNDEIKDYHCEKVKKAYPAYFDTYSEIDTLITYLNGFNNLYCIGRNGQHRYNNMDHSMATAFETVDNILSDKTDKTNIWNVNTEKEYHEEK
jgi:protoporphyrinogen oxidase